MTIFDFDTNRGIYHFEFSDLNTETHAHPVVEMVIATQGSFALESHGLCTEGLTFAIIDANTKHRLISQNSTVQCLMIESHNTTLDNFFEQNDLGYTKGVFKAKRYPEAKDLLIKTKNVALEQDLKKPEDKRVQHCIEFIQKNDVDFKDLIHSLKELVFLSDSRLSHLFKEHVGISIKKYLVWHRLRQAIKQYLSTNTNLTDISLDNGFFDQAHLSNSFKSILGVSPSMAYNSRILQS